MYFEKKLTFSLLHLQRSRNVTAHHVFMDPVMIELLNICVCVLPATLEPTVKPVGQSDVTNTNKLT